MTKSKEPTIIKKYANRRLYNTGTSTYVTLDDLAEMVKGEEDFVVYDAKTGEDITRPVLTQIIFEQENKGPHLMPVTFLRQLIRFYGDSLHKLVPSYLDASIASFVKEQARFREQMTSAFGTSAFVPGAFSMEEQVRRNTEIFERAIRMFLPFGSPGSMPESRPDKPSDVPTVQHGSDLDDLKRQMEEMQRKLEALSARKEG